VALSEEDSTQLAFARNSDTKALLFIRMKSVEFAFDK